MPRYIALQRDLESLGQYDLPDYVTGDAGHSFRLHSVVGGGGNGVVFRASPQGELATEIDDCAIKFLRQQSDVRKDRFRNEIRIMRLLAHQRVSQLFEIGTLSVADKYEVPWLAMELGGANLRAHVHGSNFAAAKGPITGTAALMVARQLCDAVEHLHLAQVIHRDLKPDNFVWDGEDGASVLMIDFGIAKLLREDVSGRPLDSFTKQMEFVGPAQWASPELIAYARDKAHPVDERSDLFQLAKTIWFLATGKISAGVPSRRDCPFGGQLHEIVVQMLADDPSDRLRSAAELREALGAISVGGPATFGEQPGR
jgi:serine/threonine protein kinase